ncbi:MAG: glycoside hydrolase domain-containing protein [Phycisphaerales bacterium]
MLRHLFAAGLCLLAFLACTQRTTAQSGDQPAYASADSVQAFLARFPGKAYLTFPEARERPIRILDGLPEAWTDRTPEALTTFQGEPQPGEYYVFQVGLFAARGTVKDVQVHFSGLTGQKVIPGSALTCFNLGGIDHKGRAFRKTVDVVLGRVQPLWFGVQVPADARGVYEGKLAIGCANAPETEIAILLNVTGSVLADKGVDDPRGLARLSWLNSTIAHDDEVTRGYRPVTREGETFDILGRQIHLSRDGLPASILSFFGPNNQTLVEQGQPILASGFRFIVETSDGRVLSLTPEPVRFTKEVPSTLAWSVRSASEEVELLLEGTAEFDGFLAYTLTLNPLKDLDVKDIRLEVPVTSGMSRYMMGMGKTGGLRPDAWDWKWDVQKKSQDAVWLGGVHGGLRIKLKGKNYHRQLVNIYYEFCPLSLPDSWGNEGRGGVEIRTGSQGTSVKAYSGARSLRKGQTLNFDFELLVTPVKLIDREVQYNDRYFHDAGSQICDDFIARAQKSGANIINIHHGKDLNPFINYPYVGENVPHLAKFVADAHAQDIRTKVYYTTRELTVNTPEIWAMRSLDGEVIYPGPGKDAKTVINPNGPHPWLAEHFKEGFIPAWKHSFDQGPYKGRTDLSVITTPDSRLNNFYLEGLDWMCKNIGIDGMYIDDSALDRTTMKRARKILDRNRPAARIDLHTWNHFNNLAGWACCLNLYMDLLPYFDQLWIGEGRSYDLSPDYWLVEISGIPFGVTSQMLEGGGNPWRGMVFGMTNRLGWGGPTPEHIWRFWDEYRFVGREMIGFWDANCPVKTDTPSLGATVFRGEKDAIVALANWTDKPVEGRIAVDWQALGMKADACTAMAPAITDSQEGGVLDLAQAVPIEGKKGIVVVLRPAP